MERFWSVIASELNSQLPDFEQFVRIAVRLLLAMLLSGIIGWEREEGGKSAGLRTHMLVALGSALFALSALEAGASVDEVTRVVQGIATGIGFIGGGVILKLTDERRVKGLTTAASIWLTAAIGTAAGLGRGGVAVTGLIFAWIVLSTLRHLERRLRKPGKAPVERHRTQAI